MITNKKCIRTISLAVLCAFVQSFVLFEPVMALTTERKSTAASDVKARDGFILPCSYGRVVESSLVPGESLVIYIQDLHCHPEVQKNICRIIEAFDREYGVEKIFAEGAKEGRVDLGLLSTLPVAELRNGALDDLLEDGLIGGAEYYAVVSGTDKLCGLENGDVYQANLQRIRRLIADRERLRSAAEDVNSRIEVLKARYFSVRMRRMERLLGRDGGSDVPERRYLKLDRLCARLDIDETAYPNLALYTKALRLNRKLDRRQVSGEYARYLVELRSKLPYSVYGVLNEKSRHADRAEEYYLSLADIADGYTPDLRSRYPSLDSFLEYVRSNYAVNPLRLCREDEALRRELLDRYAERDLDRELLFLSAMGSKLSDFLNLRISSDDLDYFSRNAGRFKRLLCKYFPAEVTGSIVRCIDEDELRRFYETNLERDGIFIEAIGRSLPHAAGAPAAVAAGRADGFSSLHRVREYRHVAVVVTGGFHSGILEGLRKKGISCISIVPNITTGTDDTVYSRVLTDRLNIADFLRSAFSVEMLKDRLAVSGTTREIVLLDWARNAVSLLAGHKAGIAGINAAIGRWLSENGMSDRVYVYRERGGDYRIRVNDHEITVKASDTGRKKARTARRTPAGVCKAISRMALTVGVFLFVNVLFPIQAQAAELYTKVSAGCTQVIANVVPGDCVWKIAKQYLIDYDRISQPTNAQIYDKMMAIINANPEVAKHPDLIFPGNELLVNSIQNPPVTPVQPATVPPSVTPPVATPVLPHASTSSPVPGAVSSAPAPHTFWDGLNGMLTTATDFVTHNWMWIAAIAGIILVNVIYTRWKVRKVRRDIVRKLGYDPFTGTEGTPAAAKGDGRPGAQVPDPRVMNGQENADKGQLLPSEQAIRNHIRDLREAAKGTMPDLVIVLPGSDQRQKARLEEYYARRSGPLAAVPFAVVPDRGEGTLWTLPELYRYFESPEFAAIKAGRDLNDMSIVVLNVNGLDRSIIDNRSLPLEIVPGEKTGPLELALYNGIRITQEYRKRGRGVRAIMDPQYLQVGSTVAADDVKDGITALLSYVPYDEVVEQKLPLLLRHGRSGAMYKVYSDFDDEQVRDDLEKNELGGIYSLAKKDGGIVQIPTCGNIVISGPAAGGGDALGELLLRVGAYLDRVYAARAPPPELNFLAHFLTPVTMEKNGEDALSYGVKLRPSFSHDGDEEFYRDDVLGLFELIKGSPELLDDFELNTVNSSVSLFSRACAQGQESASYRKFCATLSLAESQAEEQPPHDGPSGKGQDLRRRIRSLWQELRRAAALGNEIIWKTCESFAVKVAGGARDAALFLPRLVFPRWFITRAAAVHEEAGDDMSSLENAGYFLDDWEALLREYRNTADPRLPDRMLTKAQRVVIITRLSNDLLFGDSSPRNAVFQKRFCETALDTVREIDARLTGGSVGERERRELLVAREYFNGAARYALEYLHALDFSINLEILSGYRYSDADLVERFGMMRINRRLFQLEAGFMKSKEALEKQVEKVVGIGNLLFRIDRSAAAPLYDFPTVNAEVARRIATLEVKEKARKLPVDRGGEIRKSLGRFTTMIMAVITVLEAVEKLVRLMVIGTDFTSMGSLGQESANLLGRNAVYWAGTILSALGMPSGPLASAVTIAAFCFFSILLPLSLGIGTTIFLHWWFIQRGRTNDYYDAKIELLKKNLAGSSFAVSLESAGDGLRWDSAATAEEGGQEQERRKRTVFEESGYCLDRCEALLSGGTFGAAEIDQVRYYLREVVIMTPFSRNMLDERLMTMLNLYQRVVDIVNGVERRIDALPQDERGAMGREIRLFRDTADYGYAYYRALSYVYNINSFLNYRITKGTKWASLLEIFPVMALLRLPFGIGPGIQLSEFLLHRNLDRIAALGNRIAGTPLYDAQGLRDAADRYLESKKNKEFLDQGMSEGWRVSRMLRRLLPIVFLVVRPIMDGTPVTWPVLLVPFMKGSFIAMALQSINVFFGFIDREYLSYRLRRLKHSVQYRLSRKRDDGDKGETSLRRRSDEIASLLRGGSARLPDRVIVMCGDDRAREERCRKLFAASRHPLIAGLPYEFVRSDAPGSAVSFFDGLGRFEQGSLSKNGERIIIVTVDGTPDEVLRRELPLSVDGKPVTVLELALLNSLLGLRKSTAKAEISIADPNSILLGGVEPSAERAAANGVTVRLRRAKVSYHQLVEQGLPFIHKDNKTGKLKMFYRTKDIKNALLRRQIARFYKVNNPELRQFSVLAGPVNISINDTEEFYRFSAFCREAAGSLRELAAEGAEPDAMRYGLIPLSMLVNGENPLSLWSKFTPEGFDADRTKRCREASWKVLRLFEKNRTLLETIGFATFADTIEDVFTTADDPTGEDYRRQIALMARAGESPTVQVTEKKDPPPPGWSSTENGKRQWLEERHRQGQAVWNGGDIPRGLLRYSRKTLEERSRLLNLYGIPLNTGTVRYRTEAEVQKRWLREKARELKGTTVVFCGAPEGGDSRLLLRLAELGLGAVQVDIDGMPFDRTGSLTAAAGPVPGAEGLRIAVPVEDSVVYARVRRELIEPEAGGARALRLLLYPLGDEQQMDGASREIARSVREAGHGDLLSVHRRKAFLARGTLSLLRELQQGRPELKAGLIAGGLPIGDLRPAVLHVSEDPLLAACAVPGSIVSDNDDLGADRGLQELVLTASCSAAGALKISGATAARLHLAAPAGPDGSVDIQRLLLRNEDELFAGSEEHIDGQFDEAEHGSRLPLPQDRGQLLRRLLSSWSACMLLTRTGGGSRRRTESGGGVSFNRARIIPEVEIRDATDLRKLANRFHSLGLRTILLSSPLTAARDRDEGRTLLTTVVDPFLADPVEEAKRLRLGEERTAYIARVMRTTSSTDDAAAARQNRLSMLLRYCYPRFVELCKTDAAERSRWERFRACWPQLDGESDYLAAAWADGTLPESRESIRATLSADPAKGEVYRKLFAYMVYVASSQLKDSAAYAAGKGVNFVPPFNLVADAKAAPCLLHPEAFNVSGKGNDERAFRTDTVDFLLPLLRQLTGDLGFQGMAVRGIGQDATAGPAAAMVVYMLRSIRPDCKVIIERDEPAEEARPVAAGGIITLRSVREPRELDLIAGKVGPGESMIVRVLRGEEGELLPETFSAAVKGGLAEYVTIPLAGDWKAGGEDGSEIGRLLDRFGGTIAASRLRTERSLREEGRDVGARFPLDRCGDDMIEGMRSLETLVLRDQAGRDLISCTGPGPSVLRELEYCLRKGGDDGSLPAPGVKEQKELMKQIAGVLMRSGLTEERLPGLWAYLRKQQRRIEAATSPEEGRESLCRVFGCVDSLTDRLWYRHRCALIARGGSGNASALRSAAASLRPVIDQKAFAATLSENIAVKAAGKDNDKSAVERRLLLLRKLAGATGALVAREKGRAMLLDGSPAGRELDDAATFLCMPDLLLRSGEYDICKEQLQRYADEQTGRPSGSADAALWFIEALHRYVEKRDDPGFCRRMLPTVNRIVEGYLRGGGPVACDSDCLLTVTPGCRSVFGERTGKPVELQALWYNGLRISSELNDACGDEGAARRYASISERVKKAVNERYFVDGRAYPLDSLDGGGTSDALKPYGLLLLSLSAVDGLVAVERSDGMIAAARDSLFTYYGLRATSRWSASSGAATILPWFLAVYGEALRRSGRESYAAAKQRTETLANGLSAWFSAEGTLPELFTGEGPFEPGGAPWSTLTSAALLSLLGEDEGAGRIETDDEDRDTGRLPLARELKGMLSAG